MSEGRGTASGPSGFKALPRLDPPVRRAYKASAVSHWFCHLQRLDDTEQNQDGDVISGLLATTHGGGVCRRM